MSPETRRHPRPRRRWPLLALGVLAAAAAAPVGRAAAAVTFSGTNVLANANPAYVVAADLNRDGNLDLAVSNAAPSDTVSILLGNGAGGFGMPTTLATPNPRAIAVGDFNGDGKADLAVANANPAIGVSVFIGNGGGTFTPVAPGNGTTPTFTLGAGGEDVHGVAVGDVTGDGIADIVAGVSNTANTAERVVILKGDGTGNFTAQPGPPKLPGGSRVIAVAIANLDANAIPDIATANLLGNSTSILLGLGGGAFNPALTFPAQTNPDSIAIGDFNQDGRSDVAIGNEGGSVSVFLGTGTGVSAVALNSAIGGVPTIGNPADFNGDGILDVPAALFATAGSAAVVLGGGNGRFGPPDLFAAGTDSQFVAPGDFNGDGKPDLVVANSGSANVTVLLNTTAFPPPGATTGAASAVTQTTAAVSGTVIPHGQPTSFKFQFGTTAAYGAETPAQSAGSGVTGVSATQALSGLQPGTTYHYRLVATDRFGTGVGADATLTTAGAPPPPPKPPPSGLSLTRATFSVRWTVSRPSGVLRYAGTTTGPRALTIALRRPGAKKALVRAKRSVKAGAFSGRLRVPRSLLPGSYRLEAQAAGVATAARVARLAAPPQGVVRRAVILTRPTASFHARIKKAPKQLFATFTFAARPKKGRRITAAFTTPSGVKGRTIRLPRQSVVTTFVGSTAATAPVPKGRWRCTLRVGRTVVAVASVRVG